MVLSVLVSFFCRAFFSYFLANHFRETLQKDWEISLQRYLLFRYVKMKRKNTERKCVLSSMFGESKHKYTYRSKLIRERNAISNGDSIVYWIPYESRPPRFTHGR